MTQETKSLFSSNQNKGFQMTFENGLTISVQWGTGNYCSRKSLHTIPLSGEYVISSPDAEIAVWDANDTWLEFQSDQVKGYCSTDEVAQVINFVRGAKSLVDLREILQEFNFI